MFLGILLVELYYHGIGLFEVWCNYVCLVSPVRGIYFSSVFTAYDHFRNTEDLAIGFLSFKRRKILGELVRADLVVVPIK
jgi:hypothetical protein